MPSSSSSIAPRCSLRWAIVTLLVIVILAIAGLFTDSTQFAGSIAWLGGRQPTVRHVHIVTDEEGHYLALPEILLERGIYPNGSFANEFGVVPAYWEGSTSGGDSGTTTYGPCYGYPHSYMDWEAQIEKYNMTQVPWYNSEMLTRKRPRDLEGYCRPGFVIIGAGKCGTSSLYHYITSHPKVLPASQKQIHYFKYHLHEPIKWYYQHFPSTASFLSAGALMSGEASPGYLPYPEVIISMRRSLPEPRILMIGRNPLERAFSSYKYNYVQPTTKFLYKGKLKNIPKRQLPEFYLPYLFSFEDMMRAELAVLRECFAAGSKAEQDTRKRWGRVSWIADEYERREKEGLPPLIDMDAFCYGDKVNKTVLRRQWTEMVASQPDKILLDRNLHLTQAFIGRSLYLFPLEWWYAAFPSEHIYFVCTEELQDFTGESMNNVGKFLGLPRYDNFSDVVQGGAYNVGGHRGYDLEISWSEITSEQEEQGKDDLPLSESLRLELEEFIRPFNERLFSLTGRRCNW